MDCSAESARSRAKSRGSRRSARPLRRCRRSRSARSGSGAEDRVRSTAGSPGSGPGRRVSRGTAPRQSLFQVGGQAWRPLLREQILDLGPGDDHEVMAGRKILGDRPEGLAQGSLHLVPLDRAADLAADRDAKTYFLALLVLAGELVEHQVAGRMRGAVAIDAVELAASRKAPSLGRHQRTG